jgi:transcriptional regulator with XRE-family HTH domain
MEPSTSSKVPRPYDREKANQLMQATKDAIRPESKRFVWQSHAIAEKLVDELKRQKLKPSAFAERIGKSRAEVRSWMTGMHNLTMRTISTIETALGTDFIMVLPAGVTERQVLELLAKNNLIDKQEEIARVGLPETLKQDKSSGVPKRYPYPVNQDNYFVNHLAEDEKVYSSKPNEENSASSAEIKDSDS